MLNDFLCCAIIVPLVVDGIENIDASGKMQCFGGLIGAQFEIRRRRGCLGGVGGAEMLVAPASR
jgi:hypothetical protein